MSIIAIESVTLFPAGQGNGVAGVKLACGPVVVHAKLRRQSDGNLVLSMPSRVNQRGRRYDQAYFSDPQVRATVQSLAIAAYQALTG